MSLVASFAVACSTPRNPRAIDFQCRKDADGTTEGSIRTSGLVVVTGGRSRSEADGSTTLASEGDGREVEVRINPYTKPINSDSKDFRGLGGVTRSEPSDPDEAKVAKETEDSFAFVGGFDVIQARSATIGAPSEAGYVIVLHDALMNHARRPIPVVTVTWTESDD